jgi:hypothetical protein
MVQTSCTLEWKYFILMIELPEVVKQALKTKKHRQVMRHSSPGTQELGGLDFSVLAVTYLIITNPIRLVTCNLFSKAERPLLFGTI